MKPKKDLNFRIELRERLVDTGYCQVTQWRNFSDAINIMLINKELAVKQDMLKEVYNKVTSILNDYEEDTKTEVWSALSKFREELKLKENNLFVNTKALAEKDSKKEIKEELDRIEKKGRELIKESKQLARESKVARNNLNSLF